MTDSANSKPRVLLSIMKGEGFEPFGDSSDLCTAIIAGFGRFECERVLKPSGVELMNLSHSANIEISVLKRERETGQKHLLLRGLIPLGALHSSFFAGDGGGEPQAWESWVGLFTADVSLKGQSPERVFQQSLDMGSAPNRGAPRLYIRLQYLQAGATATPQPPPTATNQNMEISMRGQLNMHLPSQAGAPFSKPFGSGMFSQQAERLPPTSGVANREGSVAAPGKQLPTWASRGTTGGTARLTSAAPQQVRPQNRSTSPQVKGPLAHGTSLIADGSRGSPIPFQRNRSGSKESISSGADFRAKCEELEKSKSASQEKIVVLERALRDATEKNQAMQQDFASQRQLQGVELAELRQMVAELRLAKETIEQENLRLYGQEGAREDAIRSFFEQAAPSLSGLGRPFRVQPAEAVASAESMQAQFAHIAKTLADALVERSSGGTVQDIVPEEETNLFGECLERALGGSEEFDSWFSRKLDASTRSRLGKANRLLSACGQAAQLKDASRRTVVTENSESLTAAVGPFYVPVKTDPLDLYMASTLLRLSSDPKTASAATTAAAGLLRIEPNKYSIGPDGAVFHCSIDALGQVMVQIPSGNNNEAQTTMLFSDFLMRGRG